MKVQCDVCAAEAASVFCCPDEAALCDACDRRIHSANKLAGKHRRLSLLHPSPQSPPLCDICQERRGFLFCREDRAILCRDCDVPIHTANDLTMNHSRFLLTGVRLSSAPPPEAEVVDDKSNDNDNDKDVKIKNHCNKSHENVVVVAAEEEVACCSSRTTSTATAAATALAADGGNSSSISEYLIKMLPGWHVEDFLTDDADAFYQVNEDLLKGSSGLSGVGEEPPIWVPQAKNPVEECQAGHFFQGFVGSKASRRRWGEASLRVPQIHSNKRCRTAVWYS